MILDDAKQDVAVNGNFKTSGFKIQATSKAFDILSSNIYTHKVKAVVREISCNAHDAHIAAGNSQPFNVHLPTTLEPWFSVRDFGTGLSDTDVREIFSTYFCSTKTGSNDFIGALGLGSKSPFALVDSFTVKSYFNGTVSDYSCYRDQNGEPQVALLTESATTEPNGLEVSLSIEDKQDEFREEAVAVYLYFDQIPNINDKSVVSEIEELKSDFIFSGEDFELTKGHGRSKAVMGGVAYDIPHEYDQLELRGCIKFELGEISFDAGRESLSLDDKTKAAIKNKFKDVISKLSDHAESQIKALPTAWERALLADKLREGSIGNKIGRDMLDKYMLPKIPDSSKKIEYYRRSWRSTANSTTNRLPLGDHVEYFVFKPRFTHRIRQYVKGFNSKTLVLLTEEQIKTTKIDPAVVQDLDVLPVVVRSSGQRGSNVKTFLLDMDQTWGKGRQFWDEHVVQLDGEEKVYVEISRFEPVDGTVAYYSKRMKDILLQLQEEGVPVPAIYGLKSAFLQTKKFTKSSDWISLEDYLRRELPKLLPLETMVCDSRQYDVIEKLFENISSPELSEWFDLAAKESNERPHVRSIADRLNIKPKENLELDEFQKTFFEMYPMLNLVRDYSIDERTSKTIAEYINGVAK